MSDSDRPSAVLDELPPPLPAEQIVALNGPRGDLHTTRRYEWNGATFDVPPAVFRPGATSAMIFDRLRDGGIPVRGRHYLALGTGLGVDAVAAGLGGAAQVWASDVHPASVATAEEAYERLVGRSVAPFFPLVSDLLDALPPDTRLDVITFNPPLVSQQVSTDPDVVRNVCVGASILERLFAQIVARDALAPGGEVVVAVSNTADLRAVVSAGVEQGFVPEVLHHHDWQDGVQTYLFRFTREGGR